MDRGCGAVELLPRSSAVKCAMQAKTTRQLKTNVLPSHWLEPPLFSSITMKLSQPAQSHQRWARKTATYITL